ncbi:MAG: hypothetical protein ABIK28_11070 [Planctomycetota bacterium]
MIRKGLRIYARFIRQLGSSFFPRIGGLFFCATLLFPSTLWSAEELPKLLQQVREAMGYDALRACRNGIVAEGHGESQGLESRFTLYLSSDTRFRMDTCSALGYKYGFDGQKGWNVDASQMLGHLEFKELEVAKLNHWLMNGHWLDKACPFELSLDKENKISDEMIRIKAILPEGNMETMIHIERATALPVRMSWTHQNKEAQPARGAQGRQKPIRRRRGIHCLPPR